eukprot:2349244-Pleurochrysis_carterae.AAC.1
MSTATRDARRLLVCGYVGREKPFGSEVGAETQRLFLRENGLLELLAWCERARARVHAFSLRPRVRACMRVRERACACAPARACTVRVRVRVSRTARMYRARISLGCWWAGERV